MQLFYLISLFFLVGALVKIKWQPLFIYISFLLLFVISGFRDVTVGTDTQGYNLLFSRLAQGTSIRQEIGWQFLNKIIIFFGGSFQDLLLISTLLVLIPVFYIIKKYSSNPMFSIFLYFTFYIYLQSLNITRQSIAVSIIFCSYPFLIKNKYFYFSLIVILASTFHITALLCLSLIFIHRIPDKISTYIILIVSSLIIGVFAADIIMNKFASYFGYIHYLYKFESGEQTGIFLIVINVIAVLILLTIKDRNLLFKIFVLYIVLANLSSRIPFGHRIITYLSIIQVLFLPYYLNSNKIKHRPVAFLLIVGYAYIVFYRNAGAGEIIPYINTLLN